MTVTICDWQLSQCSREVTMSNHEEAQKLKAEGNKAYQKKAFEKATQLYNQVCTSKTT